MRTSTRHTADFAEMRRTMHTAVRRPPFDDEIELYN